MTVLVEVPNPITQKLKQITGETSDRNAIKVALERFVRDYDDEPKKNGSDRQTLDLPDEFWDELFSQPMLPAGTVERIIREEREDPF